MRTARSAASSATTSVWRSPPETSTPCSSRPTTRRTPPPTRAVRCTTSSRSWPRWPEASWGFDRQQYGSALGSVSASSRFSGAPTTLELLAQAVSELVQHPHGHQPPGLDRIVRSQVHGALLERHGALEEQRYRPSVSG